MDTTKYQPGEYAAEMWLRESEHRKEMRARGHEPERNLFSRSQWRIQHGRRVMVPDSQAKKIVVSRNNGHNLALFSFDQTIEGN
jgi:hypothetical protein